MARSDGDAQNNKLKDPLVWIDLEMTGLDPQRHVIVEAAVIVTDGTLQTILEGPEIVLGASDKELSEMDDVVIDMHTKSGLLERIKESSMTVAEGEALLLEFVKQHVPQHRQAPLAGNSIHADRTFLDAYMPTLAGHVHYRNVDVSTIKEIARRWYPDLAPFEKTTNHRALSDIRESIGELDYYRRAIFRDEAVSSDDQSPQ